MVKAVPSRSTLPRAGKASKGKKASAEKHTSADGGTAPPWQLRNAIAALERILGPAVVKNCQRKRKLDTDLGLTQRFTDLSGLFNKSKGQSVTAAFGARPLAALAKFHAGSSLNSPQTLTSKSLQFATGRSLSTSSAPSAQSQRTSSNCNGDDDDWGAWNCRTSEPRPPLVAPLAHAAAAAKRKEGVQLEIVVDEAEQERRRQRRERFAATPATQRLLRRSCPSLLKDLPSKKPCLGSDESQRAAFTTRSNRGEPSPSKPLRAICNDGNTEEEDEDAWGSWTAAKETSALGSQENLGVTQEASAAAPGSDANSPVADKCPVAVKRSPTSASEGVEYEDSSEDSSEERSVAEADKAPVPERPQDTAFE